MTQKTLALWVTHTGMAVELPVPVLLAACELMMNLRSTSGILEVPMDLLVGDNHPFLSVGSIYIYYHKVNFINIKHCSVP